MYTVLQLIELLILHANRASYTFSIYFCKVSQDLFILHYDAHFKKYCTSAKGSNWNMKSIRVFFQKLTFNF